MAEEPLFPVVMRGYDRAQVEEQITSLESHLSTTRAQVAQLDEEVLKLSAQLAQAQSALKENDRPSYSGLGTRVERLLKSTEEQALDLMTRARQEASSIVETAQERADQLRRAAQADSQKHLLKHALTLVRTSNIPRRS